MPSGNYGLADQFDTAMNAVVRGDFDLLERLMVDPRSVTPTDERTAAEFLGLKRGFLAAAVNVVADPTVWLAALMSRRFPVKDWLRGTVPDRLIGTSAEFSGISLFTRPVEDFFRGTAVPRLTALTQKRQAEVMEVGRKLLDQFSTRPNWANEMPVVSLLMEGQNPSGATPELRNLATSLRGHMDDLWGFLRKSHKVEGGFGASGEMTLATSRSMEGAQAPTYLRDYLPHMPLTVKESIVEADGVDALKRMKGGVLSQMMSLRGMNPEEVWRIEDGRRLSSDFVKWQAWSGGVGHQINPRLFKRQRFGVALESPEGRELFVTDLNVILPKYIHSVARTYANYAPLSDAERALVSFQKEGGEWVRASAAPPIVQVLNEGFKASGARIEAEMIKGTDVVKERVTGGSKPILMGLQNLVKGLKGDADDSELLFGNMMNTVLAKVDSVKGSLTGRQMTDLERSMKAFERTRTFREKANGIASYFYATTLGLNPWSALQNLLQPIITTIPAIGLGGTIKGYERLLTGLPTYAREVRKEMGRLRGANASVPLKINEALERGFYNAFPEMRQAGVRIDPRLFELDENLIQSQGLVGGLGKRLFKDRDSYYRMLLQPFTHAEAANQVVTFYGSKAALRNSIRRGEYLLPEEIKHASGAQVEEALNFEAGLTTSSAQFRPGPGTRTWFQSLLPAPLYQFTSFPTRALSFFVNSTTRGALTRRQLQSVNAWDAVFGASASVREMAQKKVLSLGTGRNMGVLARSYLYGRVLSEGASQVLGIDLSEALGPFSAYNPAPTGQPFAPFPLPPIAGVAFGIGSYATTRDIKQLQPLDLPGLGTVPFPKTLVPGGVAVSRLGRIMRQFQPDAGGYLDDDERLMYRGDSTDRLLAALGVPLDKNRRARHVVEKVQANRELTKDLRREYARAIANYDTKAMGLLEQRWRKLMPDMPPITVESVDVQRYDANAQIPITSRTLRTMGERGKLLEADIYEYDPEIVAEEPPMTGGALSQVFGY